MKECVLTIGKFDGVHTGHAVLLSQVAELAAERGLQPAVMTFDPHPACVVAPERAPRPLMQLEERCVKIRALGIEEVFILPFTHEISKLSPEEFVSRYVRGRMQARVVMVGRNFRFGYKQAGDPEALAQLGARYGFETRLVEAVKLRGLIVSASEIRRRIEAGEVSLAARLLGRAYALEGEVVAGFGIGSRQTVPTLNLRTSAEVLPRDGVYITRTHDLESDRCWNSITNIGMRPTFEGTARTIETFLLEPVRGLPLLHSRGSEAQSSVGATESRSDPEKPIPSRDGEAAVEESPRTIRVELLRRVRDERKFATPEALKTQILLDVARARTYFRRVARWVRVALP
jgi:riboflavin kinase / FMN adenylyltransferase